MRVLKLIIILFAALLFCTLAAATIVIAKLSPQQDTEEIEFGSPCMCSECLLEEP